MHISLGFWYYSRVAKPVKVGIIGCGNISAAYLRNGETFEILDFIACADIVLERAQERAAEFGVPMACSPEELLADPEIEMVINLTIPAVHGEVGMAALDAGKHVYSEKPLTITREDGRRLLESAQAKGLRVGSAPDTFLGGGLQTCRKVIDDGEIGDPIAATAFMLGHGMEAWHPDPYFFYQPGAGPMFDMGPYYLTALATLIGPVRRVTGSTHITFPERTITSEAKYGQTIPVNTPTHIAGVMDFENGAIGTIITSFDVWASQLPRIEIYGTEGTLSVPDPNTFGGPVLLRRAQEKEWTEVPLAYDYTSNSRGLGAADMAHAIRSGRQHRANGEIAYHVLDLMHAFHEASDQSRHIEMQSTCSRPAPFPTNLQPGLLDD